MKIEQIFSKKLTRDINGVVKAEQKDNDSVYVELDEYVVTFEHSLKLMYHLLRKATVICQVKLAYGFLASLARVNRTS